MNSFYKLILLISTIVLTASAKDKIDISTIPESDSIYANIDTITVISDALIAINDYYSASASYIADSLILLGAKQALINKGYTAGTMKPLLMGSFICTTIDVPVKPRNSQKIKPALLPYVFANKATQNQINALKNINRKLYLSLRLSQYVNMNEIFATDRMKIDLDTISKLIKGQYALFVFHQANLTYQAAANAIGFATYLIAGLPAAIAATLGSQINAYHTYYILVELSTGSIVWNDYSMCSLFPNAPVLKTGQKNSTDITEFIDEDSLYNSILNNWLTHHLSEFPKRTSSGNIEKNSETYSYPIHDFFVNKYFKLTDYPTIGKNRIKTIDSLIIALSISDNIGKWEDPDIIADTDGKGRPGYAIESELELLDSCLLYAYRCRLQINAAVQGELKLGFSIAKDGKIGNAQVLESSLNDPILEYAAAYIIKTIHFKSVRTWPGTTRVVHEISFQKPHR